MNTLRILKGEDINVYVDDELLCFVTSFVATESSDVYKIEEFLCDEAFDTIPLNKSYEITLKALSHLDGEVFEKQGFTLSVTDNNKKYEYLNCCLKSKEKEAMPQKPLTNKYMIVAAKMKVSEVQT